LTSAEAQAARSAPPFRQFSAWLEAFNSGNRNRMQQYLQASYPSANIDMQMNFRERSGGFELRKLEQATPTTLVGLVQERGSDQFGRFTLVIEPTEPYKIVRLALTAIPRPAEFPVARLSEGELVTALRAKLESDAATDRFAGAALVARIGDGKDQVLFNAAYGLADRENKVANTVDTRFRIGSMNKMFTAVAILQLVQAGKIELDAPLGRYITDYPNRDVATRVTIHQLLTHTGGTGDIFGPDYDARRLELRALDDYVKLYGAHGLGARERSRGRSRQRLHARAWSHGLEPEHGHAAVPRHIGRGRLFNRWRSAQIRARSDRTQATRRKAHRPVDHRQDRDDAR